MSTNRIKFKLEVEGKEKFKRDIKDTLKIRDKSVSKPQKLLDPAEIKKYNRSLKDTEKTLKELVKLRKELVKEINNEKLSNDKRMQSLFQHERAQDRISQTLRKKNTLKRTVSSSQDDFDRREYEKKQDRESQKSEERLERKAYGRAMRSQRLRVAGERTGRRPSKSLFSARGMMAGAGLGALALAGKFIGGRVMGGVNQFQESLDSRIQLMGKGFRSDQMDYGLGDRRRFGQQGLDLAGMRNLQLAGISSFGRRGRSVGDFTESMLGAQRLSRATGTDAVENVGRMDQLRARVGGKEAERSYFRMMAGAVASGNEDSLSQYFDSTVGLLASINEGGVGATTEVIKLMEALRGTKMVAPEMAARRIQGVDQTIKVLRENGVHFGKKHLQMLELAAEL